MLDFAISLFPALVVLVLGYCTKRLITSLFIGIILAAFIATDYSLYETSSLACNKILHNLEFGNFVAFSKFWNGWNSLIAIFLLILGIVVTLLQHSGSAYSYVNFMSKKIHDAKTAETSTMFLSTSLFMDDYFSSLTVGSVMQPLTDQQKVPRVKLAFLVDSMAAPAAILCPFSSWVAAIIGFLKENGVSETLAANTLIHESPSSVYFQILPYLFYSWILIPCLWFIVRTRTSYGAMRKEEFTAAANTVNAQQKIVKAPFIDFCIPVAVLLLSIIISMIYSGGWSINNTIGFVEALQQSNAAHGLLSGGFITLIITTCYLIIRKRLHISSLPQLYYSGIKLMLPAVIILMLAWTLGDILRSDLRTGEHLASILQYSITTQLVPGLFFFIAFGIAFALGSSWGAAAMLFPIAIPLLLSLHEVTTTTMLEMPILVPSLGAILSGAVAGDHISPVSDTTIMTASSCKVPLIAHVKTQLGYCIPIITMTGLSFFICPLLFDYGNLITILVPIMVGIVGSAVVLHINSMLAARTS